MELEWEQERQSAHTSAALAGAFLGAALGADCFLAINHLAGEIPACLTVGFNLGLQEERQAAFLPPKPPPAEAVMPAPAEPFKSAIKPKVVGDYYLNGLVLRTDDAFQASTTRLLDLENDLEYRISLQYGVGEEAAAIFLDGSTGTLYRAYIQYGVDEGDAWDTLSQYIGKYRVSPLYDRFDAVYLDKDPLIPLNDTSRYNIVSVYLSDGRAFHTAAVLSEDGALFTIEAEQTASDQSEKVLANLMYTLESVRFEGPKVTEESYQSQIHVSEVRNCTYMAAAYLKTDLFGHDAFVDVYVPYSDAPIYSADGRAIRTEAHGLRVYATIVPGKDAKEVIDARHQALAATGQVYEDGVEDEMYREDLDAACKRTVYEENGQKRQAVLYADSKWEGWYLLREITGLPELVDEEYPAALKELEGIIGLTVPALERLGE